MASFTEITPERKVSTTLTVDTRPYKRKKKKMPKAAKIIVAVVVLGAMIGLVVAEDAIRTETDSDLWKPDILNNNNNKNKTMVSFLSPLYALVILVNVIGTSLLNVLYLGFGIVVKGRKAFGYKLPVMQAAEDILALDIQKGGALFSEGDAKEAQRKFDSAHHYNCHQRAHHQPLETYTTWVAFSLVGGLQYPCVTALYGLLGGIVGRVAWAKGYASQSGPGSRYKSILSQLVWPSYIGLLVNAIATCVTLLLL